jgi:hypothetical protein
VWRGGGRGEPVLRMPTARQLGHPWYFKKGGNEEGGRGGCGEGGDVPHSCKNTEKKS